MAKIIHLRGGTARPAPAEEELRLAGSIFRLRLHGGEPQDLGVAARVLGRAFVLEGFYTGFEEQEATIYLRVGREIITEIGCDRPPGLMLVIDSRRLTADTLLESDEQTVLLVCGEDPEVLKDRLGFGGTVLALPLAATDPPPRGLCLAAVGGAARLVGVVRWTALERAIREELAALDSAEVNRGLAMALESFDRLKPWAGKVRMVDEEVEIGLETD